MYRRATALALAALALTALGFVAQEKKAQPPKPTPAAVAFDRIKSLAGTWEHTTDEGKTEVALVTSVTSAGSVVREIMFPGTDHEMTNMYHLDGDALMITHYCAIGNQPRMICTDFSNPAVLTFKLKDVTNLPDPKGPHMGHLVLRLTDAEHITQEWNSIADGKAVEHVTFALTRRAQKPAK